MQVEINAATAQPTSAKTEGKFSAIHSSIQEVFKKTAAMAYTGAWQSTELTELAYAKFKEPGLSKKEQTSYERILAYALQMNIIKCDLGVLSRSVFSSVRLHKVVEQIDAILPEYLQSLACAEFTAVEFIQIDAIMAGREKHPSVGQYIDLHQNLGKKAEGKNDAFSTYHD